MTIYGTPIHTTSADLERLEREEAEALERMAMATEREDPKPEKLDGILTEIEKLAAGDLVYALRNADKTAKDRTEIERHRIAQAGRRLAAGLLDGCRKLERFRPDDDLPGVLQKGSSIPMDSPMTLRMS